MSDAIRPALTQKIVDSLQAPVPRLTRRDVHVPRIPGKAVAVIGMRRTGKTSFLWQLLQDRLDAGVERSRLLHVSFEDDRLAGMTVEHLNFFLEEYYRLHPEWRSERRPTFFLDEIQTVPGWEAFARRILDSEHIELFLSGSSARLLSREVATSMRGRALEALVHPFSFREYLRHLGREPAQPVERLTKTERSFLEKDLRTYLSHGGFPESLQASERDREALLVNYVDTALLRDVIERHDIAHPVALRWMVRQLLSSPAGLFSVHKLYADLRSQNISIGKDTLHAYLGYLEDAFLVRLAGINSESERQRMVNPRKAYPIDMGLISTYSRIGQTKEGHALETAVMLELERRGAQITYVRTRQRFEVDFHARYPGGRTELIQVCANLDAADTREREMRALMDAREEHPHATAHLIGLVPEMPRDLWPGIRWHAASRWLLEQTEPDD